MSVMTELAHGSAPEWLAAEMPPGYRTRLSEIQRLTIELQDMERFGGLLWQVGDPLTSAVRELFVALKFEVGSLRPGAAQLMVKLDERRRLLLHVSAADGIQKKGNDLAQAFQLLHEIAGGDDRVVLVANSTPLARPADRPEAIAPDALELVRRLGTNFVSGPTLFAVWTVFLQDAPRARATIDRLHAQDGGVFPPPAV